MKNETEMEWSWIWWLKLKPKARLSGVEKGGGFPGVTGATDSTGVDEGPWQKVLCVRVYECMRHNKSCKGAEWPGKGLEASGLRSLGIGMDLSRDVIPILPLTKPLATSATTHRAPSVKTKTK